MRYIDPEKLYNEYKWRDDIKKIINGREYIRVAASGVDRICNKEFFMIWIDKSLNCKNAPNRIQYSSSRLGIKNEFIMYIR